jgi:hypothetical protein
MRYIDLNQLLQRRKLWGEYEDLWTSKILKKDFRNFFHNKCWYTEVKLTGQDAQIDHFRPKSKVDRFQGYNYNVPLETCGYSWLRNEPSNYRTSCIFGNRITGGGGKGCFFPLSNESEYMTEKGAEREIPLLLDPCNYDDVRLISFLGKLVVATSSEPYCEERVKITSLIYNLDNEYIAPERAKVWFNTQRIIDMYAARAIKKPACILILKDMIDKSVQFSSCAIACVNSLAPEDIKAELDLVL